MALIHMLQAPPLLMHNLFREGLAGLCWLSQTGNKGNSDTQGVPGVKYGF